MIVDGGLARATAVHDKQAVLTNESSVKSYIQSCVCIMTRTVTDLTNRSSILNAL